MKQFPNGFLWGASTSSYQIEGGNSASALWEWEVKKRWERSGRAADSWRLWREDIECLKSLNLNTYRFSVEWSRIEPSPGEFREEPLEQYAQQARALRAAGIRPMVCLHHFSEPAWLIREAPGGWHTDRAPELFGRFAGKVAQVLASEVADWVSFNEPMVWLAAAYGVGYFPPGKLGMLDFDRAFVKGPLLANVLAGHTAACRAVRAVRPDARFGLVQNINHLEPARDSEDDRRATRDFDDYFHFRLVDLAKQAGALDFLGVNYYTRAFVRRTRLPFFPFGAFPGFAEVEKAMGPTLFRLLGGVRGDRPRTDMGWEVVPEGFEAVLKRAWERWRVPTLVTENGIADSDGTHREDYLRTHLAALHRAIESGAKIDGYLHWSLMDNYEWGSFKPRFGLFRVDREDGFKRSPAGGAGYFGRVAKTNALE